MENVIKLLGNTHISINYFCSKNYVRLVETIFGYGNIKNRNPEDFKLTHKELKDQAVKLNEVQENWFKSNFESVIKAVFSKEFFDFILPLLYL